MTSTRDRILVFNQRTEEIDASVISIQCKFYVVVPFFVLGPPFLARIIVWAINGVVLLREGGW